LLDQQSLRSGVTFESTSLDVEAEAENVELKFLYKIRGFGDATTGLKPLSTVKIEALDGALRRGEQPVNGPTAVNQMHTVPAPEVESEEAGEGRVIATGVDDLGHLYRDNKGKRLWPKNAIDLHYKVLLLNGPNVPALDAHGGVVESNWKSAPRKVLVRKLPSTGLIALISFATSDTSVSAREIWRGVRVGAARAQARQAKSNWHPTIVHTMSHGSAEHLTISSAKPGLSDHGSAWVVPSLAYPEPGNSSELNDLWLKNARRLQGVGFFTAQGCSSSGSAKGSGERRDKSTSDSSPVPYYTPNMTNPAQYVATPAGVTNDGAENSVGWKFGIITNGNAGRNPAQAWYNAFYKHATASHNSGKAFDGFVAAETAYDSIIRKWDRENGKNHFLEDNFDSLHHWVFDVQE
jgi:hypothetical protein